MRRSTINSYKIFIWLIAICMTNFFGFYKYLPLGNVLYSTDYCFICIALVSVIFFVERAKRKKILRPKYFWQLSIGLVVLQLVEIIWTYFQYHQPIVLTLKEAFFYFVPILCYFVFYQFRKNDNDVQYFENVLIKCSIFSSIVAIVVFIAYTYFDTNILQLNVSSLDNFRNGTIRFGVGGIVIYFSFIISLTRLIRKNKNKIDITNMVLSIIQFVYINKTRTIILYMIVMVLIILLLEKKMNRVIKAIVWFLITAGLLVAFLNIDTFSGNVSSYFATDAGIAMRFKTIDFYMSQFSEKPIFGMGLISTSKDVAGWQLLYGPTGYYYRDDVGIIGLLNKFGICGLIWLAFFFIYIWKQFKRKINLQHAIILNICIYILITLLSLNFLDPQRTMYIFLIFALGSMCTGQSKL